jgi:hypothetical protein
MLLDLGYTSFGLEMMLLFDWLVVDCHGSSIGSLFMVAYR